MQYKRARVPAPCVAVPERRKMQRVDNGRFVLDGRKRSFPAVDKHNDCTENNYQPDRPDKKPVIRVIFGVSVKRARRHIRPEAVPSRRPERNFRRQFPPVGFKPVRTAFAVIQRGLLPGDFGKGYLIGKLCRVVFVAAVKEPPAVIVLEQAYVQYIPAVLVVRQIPDIAKFYIVVKLIFARPLFKLFLRTAYVYMLIGAVTLLRPGFCGNAVHLCGYVRNAGEIASAFYGKIAPAGKRTHLSPDGAHEVGAFLYKADGKIFFYAQYLVRICGYGYLRISVSEPVVLGGSGARRNPSVKAQPPEYGADNGD